MPFTEEVHRHAESQQAEVHSQAQVPGGAGSAQGREVAGPDREGVRGACELGRDLEALVSGAGPGGVRARGGGERWRAARRGARAPAGQEGSGGRASKRRLGAERMGTAAKVELVRAAQAEFRLRPPRAP